MSTRFPGDTEADRRIIGLFRIARIENLNILSAAENGRIRLPLEEAKALFFWAYGLYAVVEIETAIPLPGAHQAIQYRALLCADKGLPLDSSKVRSKLVAWEIPTQVAELCAGYGIEFH